MAKSIKSFFLDLLPWRHPRQQTDPPSKVSNGKWNRKRVSSVDDGSEHGDYEALPDNPPMRALSCVYWGQLKDGAEVAVKRLNDDFMKDVEEFGKEAEFLGKFCHKNLLSLRGYCAEGQERMIVYDFMHNLSLLAHLHGDLAKEDQLDWQKRVKIASGCAEALAYLHHYSSPQLVHGDIKSTNVLLNSNFEPRMGDFGMANLLKENIRKSRGAAGYMAPEDCKGEEELSKRSDVFSFGILLLELISGRNPAEKVEGDSRKLSIVEWAQNLVIGGRVDDLADPRLRGEYNREEFERLLNAAIMCAQERPENRLSMLEVVEFLSGPYTENSKENLH